jgi:hypothetical protein
MQLGSWYVCAAWLPPPAGLPGLIPAFWGAAAALYGRLCLNNNSLYPELAPIPCLVF